MVTAAVLMHCGPSPTDAFVQSPGPALTFYGRNKQAGASPCRTSVLFGGVSALSMQQQDPRRRRMLRIAEIRREIALDIQRKSDELRDTYKINRGLGGSLLPAEKVVPPQRDAKAAAIAASGDT